MPAGALLTADRVAAIPLVERGSSVTVVSVRGPVCMACPGVALAAGDVGGPLRVCLDKRYVMSTIVTGPGQCAAGSQEGRRCAGCSFSRSSS